MNKADIKLIMQTVLETSGFINAKQWAEKSELCYALAQRRIPKEVHLDWGLRSLQSVLRQGALARASICRTKKFSTQQEIEAMEKGVMIKAISDATFSRVQNRSAEIFAEILKDVFGNYQPNSSSKFGASGLAEEKLVQNLQTEDEREGNLIIQLYRAMTAKLGVCLLGKAASGKTSIRRTLFDAIQKTSGGKIQMQEFVIAPKSMSRPDLLGYVDP